MENTNTQTMQDDRVYIITYAPIPGRFEQEDPLEDILKANFTKVFLDFEKAKSYHEQLIADIGADEDDELLDRVSFIVKHLNN